MDPNEALRQTRELVADQLEQPTYEKGRKLAELVDGLDEWLSKGGALPDAWARPEGGVVKFAPGEVWLNVETGEFTREGTNE